jgi:hypothetical protein
VLLLPLLLLAILMLLLLPGTDGYISKLNGDSNNGRG